MASSHPANNRKWTEADTEALIESVLPHFGEQNWNEIVQKFASERGLPLRAVIAQVLHQRSMSRIEKG